MSERTMHIAKSMTPRRWAVSGLGLLFLAAAPAAAVTRSCGPDAVANTTDVLCASPSGPCTATTVTVSTGIDVTDGGCTFDLGGRDLVVRKTFAMTGEGFIRVFNAHSITIEDTGSLKARGDYVKPQGFNIQGGEISLSSATTISHDGKIDVTGDPGGRIELIADGDVQLLPGSMVRGVGDSSFSDDGAGLADGASVEIESVTGSIAVNGDIVVSGQNAAEGGEVVMRAARNIDVNRPIEASGGAGNGGSIDLRAGDDITITRSLNAESGVGGGMGGDISLEAGDDSLGGIVTGGALTVDMATLKLSGDSAEGAGGDGGTLLATARGPLTIGPNAIVRANAGAGFDGEGGSIVLDSGDQTAGVGSMDGDLTVEGLLRAKSGSDGGLGGNVVAAAGRDLYLNFDIDMGGKDGGGTIDASAGRSLFVNGSATASATAAAGGGGRFHGESCNLTVSPEAAIETAGLANGLIQLVAREQMVVSSASSVDADAAGAIQLQVRAAGRCDNNPAQVCLSNAECVVGCETGLCLNINPNTGGVLSQFHPSPAITENPALPACP